MKLPQKQTYIAPECQTIVLASEPCMLGGSTKDIGYEDFNYIVPVLLLLPACQRQECPVTPIPELVTHTLYASTPGEDEPQTRTIVSAGDDKKILRSARRR